MLQKIETKLGLTERAAATQAERVRAQDRIALMNRLNKEISLHPEDPELLWTMGQTASEAGSFLLASRCFEAALALDPNFQPARESLAALRAAHPDLARSPGRSTLFLPRPGSRPRRPSRLPDPILEREGWGDELGSIDRETGRGLASVASPAVRLPVRRRRCSLAPRSVLLALLGVRSRRLPDRSRFRPILASRFARRPRTSSS